MAAIFFQLVGEVDDADGFEGAFFDADAAAAAEGFCYDGFVSFNSDGFYSASNHGAEVDAEWIAFFDFAFIFIKYGNTCHGQTS